MSATKVALGIALGIALGLGFVSGAHAQQANVQISQLHCTGDPEIVVITNEGDVAQTLTNWDIRSDPDASEVFDLSVLGALAPGASISIQSGPSSSGVFSWGTNEVFRDNDATDYARIVDDTGAIVHQVDCPGVAAQPTPTPTPQPVVEVPNGGGPPPASADGLSPTMMILLGGSLAAAGLGAIALPRLRLRLSPVALPSSPGRAVARRRPGDSWGHGYSAVSLVAVALAVVVVFRILRRRPD